MPDAKQVLQLPGDELSIAPGTTLLMETFGLSRRFKSVFVGMERGRYIIVRLPANLEARRNLLPNVEITVRFLHDRGVIYGFRTSVITAEAKPFPLCFLEYPRLIEVLPLRKSERVECFFPATVFYEGQETSGMVVNISAGGMKVVFDCADENCPDVEIGKELICQFRLFDDPEETFAKGLIRAVDKNEYRHALGVQFDEVSDSIRASIQKYVDSVKQFLT